MSNVSENKLGMGRRDWKSAVGPGVGVAWLPVAPLIRCVPLLPMQATSMLELAPSCLCTVRFHSWRLPSGKSGCKRVEPTLLESKPEVMALAGKPVDNLLTVAFTVGPACAGKSARM